MTLTKPPSKTNPSKKSVAGNPSGSMDAAGSSPLPDDASWQKLRKKIVARWQRHPATKTFGDDAVDGQVYLWGLSTLLDGAVDPLSERLARLATADPTIQISDADLIPAAELFLDASREGRSDLASDLGCVLWAASLPALTQTLPLELWWGLLSELQRRVAATLAQDETPSPHHLFLAGEVGLTLAFRLADIPSCASRGKASASAVQAYLEDDEVIEEALRSPEALRVIMASIVRCEQLLQGVTKRKFKKSHQASAEELAGWIAAMTRVDGTQVFSRTAAREVSLDHVGLVSRSTSKKTTAKGSGRKSKAVKPTAPEGLMGRAMKYDTDSLMPAFSASLGQSHSGGRLAWEISLPESMWHSDEAKIVAMLPEWDVRRGRTYIDYSEEVMSVEIMAGRRTIFRGPLTATVELDGVVQYPSGPWHSTCEYTDDDVHYLELEQTYTGGVVLQRQFMLIRDDRCVMVADAVLPAQAGTASQWDHSAEDETTPANALASSSPFGELADVAIRCVTHFPVSEKISVIPDEQTRELYFHDSKRRAMMLPLPACEWRVGPTDCTAEPTEVSVNEGGVTADSQLTHGVTVATQGLGAVYSPLWIDFQSRRFHRKRTWRTLTVADELQLIPRNVATGFRIQMGSEQWMVYRSLVGRRPRSVLGKHLVADFFAGRFHASDGGVEELVTVDDAAPE